MGAGGLGVAGMSVGAAYVIFHRINSSRSGRDLMVIPETIGSKQVLPREKALLRMKMAIDALIAGRHTLPENCTELLLSQVLRWPRP